MVKSKNIKQEDLEIRELEMAETIPSEWYSDEEFYKIDLESIFYKTWQYVGCEEELQNTGDFIVAEVGNNPLIILRDSESNLRCFYNVCRHRAGFFAKDKGNANVLRCKYHGWTYNLDGKLIGTPEFDEVKCFNKSDYPLREVNVSSWEGLVFVNLSDNPEPLENIFYGINYRIKPIELTSKKFYSRIVYELNCNWKVYVDNYLEGYHLPHVHPELNDLLDYKNYVTELSENYSLQYSPLKSDGNLYSQGNEAFYYFVTPNFMLNILPGRLQTNLVVPISHNKTKVIFDYYYDDIESDEAVKFIKNEIEYSDVIQQQDITICENVYKGLASDGYHKGRLSVKREKGLYHFHNLIRKYYKDNCEL